MLHAVIAKVGIDPLHFGWSWCSPDDRPPDPPFRVVLFVMAAVSGLPFERVVRATAPFIIPLLVVLALITFFRRWSPWLPNLVMGSSGKQSPRRGDILTTLVLNPFLDLGMAMMVIWAQKN